MLNSIQIKAADTFVACHGYTAAVARIRNTSAVSVDYRFGGAISALAAGASVVLDTASNTSEIEVRRTDLSATPANVLVDFGITAEESYELSTAAAAAAVAGHDASGAAHADIRALISGISGNGAAASAFGFLPSASASANVAALQSAVDASATVGTIYVTTPGTYNMNAGIAVPSNCSIVFCAGVTLQKTAGFNAFFRPAGVPTRTVVENVKLLGCATVLKQNGQTGAGGDPTGYTHNGGLIEVYFTKNWTVSGFILDVTTGVSTFGIHGGENTGLVIEDIIQRGTSSNPNGRATIQLQAGSRNFTIRNIDATIQDDCIALNSSDYAENVLSLGDIENGIIENVKDRYWGATQSAHTLRLIQGAWAVWSSGVSTKKGDCCVSGGRQYKVMGMNSGSFPVNTTVAPAHTSGTAYGADNIIWRYMGDTTFTDSNVSNIKLRNIACERRGAMIGVIADDNEYNRDFIPGTEVNGIIDLIEVDGVTFADGDNSYLHGVVGFNGGNVGRFAIRNASIATTGKTSLVYLSSSRVASLLLEDSNFSSMGERWINTIGSGATVGIEQIIVRRSTLTGYTANPIGVQSTIYCLGDGGLKRISFESCKLVNLPNLVGAVGGVSGLVIELRSTTETGCTRLFYTAGANTPATIYRDACTFATDDGSLFYSLYKDTTSRITFCSSEAPVLYQALAAGTAYQFKGYVEAVTFGTTSPSVSVTKTGKYRVRARLLVKFNAATFAAAQTLRVRLRCGGGYYAQTVITLPVMTTATDTRIVEMPEYLYPNWEVETVRLDADMSGGPSAGTVTCEECELTIIPISQS